MLLYNPTYLLDTISIFFPSIEVIIDISSILFSISITIVGPIIHYASKKVLETLGKNAGPIAAVAGMTNVALNFYNTVQNATDKKSGGSSSSSDGDDNSKKDDDKIKKDNQESNDVIPEPTDQGS
jgi:hypothetical protein